MTDLDQVVGLLHRDARTMVQRTAWSKNAPMSMALFSARCSENPMPKPGVRLL
jgi:hypothetical protein